MTLIGDIKNHVCCLDELWRFQNLTTEANVQQFRETHAPCLARIKQFRSLDDWKKKGYNFRCLMFEEKGALDQKKALETMNNPEVFGWGMLQKFVVTGAKASLIEKIIERMEWKAIKFLATSLQPKSFASSSSTPILSQTQNVQTPKTVPTSSTTTDKEQDNLWGVTKVTDEQTDISVRGINSDWSHPLFNSGTNGTAPLQGVPVPSFESENRNQSLSNQSASTAQPKNITPSSSTSTSSQQHAQLSAQSETVAPATTSVVTASNNSTSRAQNNLWAVTKLTSEPTDSKVRDISSGWSHPLSNLNPSSTPPLQGVLGPPQSSDSSSPAQSAPFTRPQQHTSMTEDTNTEALTTTAKETTTGQIITTSYLSLIHI